jgi:hypothetical protein
MGYHKPLGRNMSRKLFVATITLLLVASSAGALHRKERSQTATKTLAERLGYPRDAKLLIVHADDLGVAHSVNSASIKALEVGLVSSASIWFRAPGFLKSQPMLVLIRKWISGCT